MKGLSSDLKWTERRCEAEFDHKIHSWFALTRVQSAPFPSAISIVHFAVLVGVMAVEAAGTAIDALRIDTAAKIATAHVIENMVA